MTQFVDHDDYLPERHDTARRQGRWPSLLTTDGRGIAFGGDYNPDQWPEEVWDEDVRLMTEAGVNTVALGIFSWGRIQPSEDTWEFEWLDRIIDKLGQSGIAVDLATATASAPLWLYERHPEILPKDINGNVINPGSRQSWRATSPVFREYALTLCRMLARRYGNSPFVTAWHINNEYGWNNRFDYSDDAMHAFQQWCKRRYGTVEAVNDAWGTAFWSQQVHAFDEIVLPRHMGDDTMVNPSQQLDFQRFSSDALKEFFIAERDAVQAICPDKPCTTNFMVSTDQCGMDYMDWSSEVDFVSNDHYFTPGEDHLDELLCSDSLVDGFAQRQPWYLMEHSTSAVQWRPVNSRKRAGELVRDALAHVAMGADAVNFFQWRQSRSGAEAFHSAMLPHAGTSTQIFRDICDLGGLLRTLSDAGMQGSLLSRGHTAILFDANSEWATESRTLPSAKLSHWHDVRAWYQALLDLGETADVVPLNADWSAYDVVVLPTLLVCDRNTVNRVTAFAKAGGKVIASYASGLVDGHFHVALGGYPGMLRELLGVYGEEFNIVGSIAGVPSTVGLSNGETSKLWQTVVTAVEPTTSVLVTYEGPDAAFWELEGMPAITRNRVGKGYAYYVGCDLDHGDISRLLHGELKEIFDWKDITTNDTDLIDVRLVHTVRIGAGMRFDYYLNRCREDIDVMIARNEVVIAYRAIQRDCVDDAGDHIPFRLESDGVVITRRFVE